MIVFKGYPPENIKQAIIQLYAPAIADPNTHFTVQTTSSYKKAGIYSAQRDDTTKPVVIDWGDGTIEQVNGDVSQKVHEYATVGTFEATISNVKTFAASVTDSTWYQTTSQNQYTLKEVALGSSVTSIGDGAFRSCSGLTSVTIPDSVTSIGDDVFFDCTGLTSVMIGNSVSTIGQSAFGGCISLTTLTIGGNELSIGWESFLGCSSLINLTIPLTVKSLGFRSFGSCSNLSQVTFEGRTISDIRNMISDGFSATFAYSGPNGSVTLIGTDGSIIVTQSCLLKGTDILLADGTTKKIENLTYNDVLKVWDFDEGQLDSAKVCWLTRPGLTSNHYYQLTFDNGTVLKTTGINSNHRIFSVDQSKFTNVCDAKVGDKVFSIDGTLTITDVKYVEEECEYYNVMTSGKINCFANGILTSDRYGNLYPIAGMKYVKDGRTTRPYSEYEAVGIDRYWYDNLRLGENTETVEKSKEYVWKCLGQMLPLPDNR